jgi:hypothetical protein
MLQDILAFLGSSAVCLGYISALGWASRRQVLEKNLSRKLMHIGERDQDCRQEARPVRCMRFE